MDEKELEGKLTLLDQLQSACTHCGLCSEACATFQSTGWEHESPRGRLQLADRLLHGNIQLKSDALSTFDRCLGCRACEVLCPQEVQYHQVRQLVQDIRTDLQLFPSIAMELSHYRQWITFAYRVSSIRWRRFGAKWLKIPQTNFWSSGSLINQSKRGKIGQPVLAVCCVQDLFQHEVIEHALGFVSRLGEALELDRNQPCCGAIFERLVQGGGETIRYSKEQKKAVRLQRQTYSAFLKWKPNQMYFLSKSCQCFISDMSDQARDQIGGLRGYQGNDFYSWIESILNQKEMTLRFIKPRTVYYQPYCRSRKREHDSIWRIMQRIQGLTIHEIVHPEACCGGYCGEVLLHPENAQKIGSQKISNLPSLATVVVTSPDCWGLFTHSLKNQDVVICYPIQILMEAQVLIDPKQSD